MSSWIQLFEYASVDIPIPVAGSISLYFNLSEQPYFKNSAGVDVPLTGVLPSTQVIAGPGLTGGGPLSANVTLTVGANGDGSIVVNADDIQVGVISDAQHGTRGGGTLHANVVAAGAAGFMTGADKTKLDGIGAGAIVVSVGATGPIASSGGANPVISLNDDGVTNAKLANVATATFKGRITAGTGDPEDLTQTQATSLINLATALLSGAMSAADFSKLAGIAAGATFYDNEMAQDAVGTILVDTATIDFTYTDATPSITADVKTASVTNALLADVPTATVKGRVAGGTGVSTDLTTTQLTTLVNIATALLSGALSAAQFRKLAGWYDAVGDFGFVGDLVSVFDGAASTGAPTKITSAGVNFVANAVIGQRITLAGAGAGGIMYVGTISAIDSTTQVTVSPSISTTVASKGLQFGTDNTAAIALMVSTINGLTWTGAVVYFGQSSKNAFGFPTQAIFTQTCTLEGAFSSASADTGDYTKLGGTRLAWWGTSSDGGTAFNPMIGFITTGGQNLKRPTLRNCFIDCRNGDQNQALKGVHFLSANGYLVESVFIMDALAISLYLATSTTPTEQSATARGSIRDFFSRQLDNPAGAVTSGVTTTTAVTLTTSGQTLAITGTPTLPPAGYVWVETNMGFPVLVNYTSTTPASGVATTALNGCVVSSIVATNAPATVNGSNVVQAVPGNAACVVADGTATANTNCSFWTMWQLSHGTTWGPAAIEFRNADSIETEAIYINGGNDTNDGAINRRRKPGYRVNGSNTSVGLASRNVTIRGGDPGSLSGGSVSAMALLNTGARMAFPSGPTYVDLIQLGNGAPIPTVESGASFDWNFNGGLRKNSAPTVSIANQAITAATLTQITGSLITIPPQGFQIGTMIRWTFIMSKTAVGTLGSLFQIRVGTLGTVADAIVQAVTTGVGTAAVDTATFVVTWRIDSIGAAAVTNAVLAINARQAATAAGWIATPTTCLPMTPTAFSTVTSGLLYTSLAITSGLTVVPTVIQCFADIINPSNP